MRGSRKFEVKGLEDEDVDAGKREERKEERKGGRERKKERKTNNKRQRLYRCNKTEENTVHSSLITNV